MRKFYNYFHLPILLLIGISAVFYFNFTAEDAYITYRYAENWINTGSLVYNEGEPINAMTSPLHAVLSAALFLVTGNTVLSNKIFSLLLVIISAWLVWHQYREYPHLRLLALLLLIPACVLLWTFGGLETPILIFLATITVILALRPQPFKLGSVCVILFLAGLAFLTRYDSILFFLPLTLYVASKAQSIKHVLAAVAVAAILPLAWLLISIYYYGDLLPTSFYVKTPKGNLADLVFNGLYIASYLLYVGIIPATVAVLVLLVPKRRTSDLLYRHFKSVWWLYMGLLLEITYGLTMATHHMMFSFRFFVPYIPATVILVVDLLRRAAETTKVDFSTGRPAYVFTGFLVCLMLFQLYQNIYTYNRSINGLSLIGEYRAVGIQEYVSFMDILKQEAVDIENHWDQVNEASGRQPRIITYAAGMLPYTYRESYVYEKLVSYRHCHERYRQGLFADYIHIVAPRQGQVDQQLPMSEDSYYLVSTHEMLFDGAMQNFLVYYNPKPEEHNLSVGINDFCQKGDRVLWLDH
jgi:arabinofuranosyltransferase